MTGKLKLRTCSYCGNEVSDPSVHFYLGRYMCERPEVCHWCDVFACDFGQPECPDHAGSPAMSPEQKAEALG